ncbi:MAG: nucleotidyltransferase domain-containing protein [Deltaproteobacteria bacterium]|nr:nucleotidyltransferase domain-containing protein [Deltaproteobacteria bacterium]
MDKIPNTIKESVQKFINAAKKQYRIEEAYLYVSHAKGNASFWSDIDIALISPDFKEDVFEERLAIMHIAAEIDDRIEPYTFT